MPFFFSKRTSFKPKRSNTSSTLGSNSTATKSYVQSYVPAYRLYMKDLEAKLDEFFGPGNFEISVLQLIACANGLSNIVQIYMDQFRVNAPSALTEVCFKDTG